MPFESHDHPKPPWWPDDESWPPRRRPDGAPYAGSQRGDWRARRQAWAERGDWPRRGGFMPRIGCFFVVVALVLASVGVLLLQLLGAILGIGGGGPGTLATPAGVVGILVGFVAVVVAFRLLRTITRPVAALGEAAGRVEGGDYAVRVEPPERGPGELRTLVSAFNTMAARLEAEDATRRRLLADVSHELRTPLAVIQGNLEALLDGVYPPDEAHIRPVLEETRVLDRLVDDLRTLSLAESGALVLHREATDVAVLLEDIAAAHRSSAAEAGVDILVVGGSPLAPLDLDPVRMRQVLSNLVENAVRAMSDGGRLTLSAAAVPSGGTALEVIDDGPGIPAEIRDAVFDRFTKSATSRGSGLGLAIARAIVEAHGGTISAASGPGGRGTAIRIELPGS